MTVLPVYRLYSQTDPTKQIFFTIQSEVGDDIARGMTVLAIPYSQEVLLIDEETLDRKINISTSFGVGGTASIYSTAAAFETARNDLLSQTGGFYLDAGTYDTVSTVFTSDSTRAFRVVGQSSSSLVAIALPPQVRMSQKDPNVIDLSISLQVGSTIF